MSSILIVPIIALSPKWLRHRTLTAKCAGSSPVRAVSRKEDNVLTVVVDVAKTGQNIEQLMENKDVTVKDVQKYLGFTTTQAIYKWFWGMNLPSVDNLVALSVFFGVKIDDLIVTREVII